MNKPFLWGSNPPFRQEQKLHRIDTAQPVNGLITRIKSGSSPATPTTTLSLDADVRSRLFLFASISVTRRKNRNRRRL